MADLKTTYLGLELKNPVVAAASPLSKKVDIVKRLEDAGVGAVVMYSLFEEQIIHQSLELDYYLSRHTESYAESLTYFPDLENYNMGPEIYLEQIQKLKRSVDIPIIGSLNGISSGGWIDYAKKIEEAGADALELNIYFVPTDTDVNGQELEDTYATLTANIKNHLNIPLSVKMNPFFTSIPYVAGKLVQAGADGLIMFNRFLQPDIDLENMIITPNLVLSTSAELRLPLRWIAILYGRIQADLALTSGVHSSEDMIKALMAGAKVTMLASHFLKNGIDSATELIIGLNTWMETNEYESVNQMIGSMSQKSVAEPAAYERANYMKALTSFDNRKY